MSRLLVGLIELLLLKCCFMSTETEGLLGTGAQDGHLDFHTAPELWVFRTAAADDVEFMSSDAG